MTQKNRAQYLEQKRRRKAEKRRSRKDRPKRVEAPERLVTGVDSWKKSYLDLLSK